jgi:hypothetical protein
MTGNNFHPEIVKRIIELIKAGQTDLRPAIRREYCRILCTAGSSARIRNGLRRWIESPCETGI